jgi:hypothetical protein
MLLKVLFSIVFASNAMAQSNGLSEIISGEYEGSRCFHIHLRSLQNPHEYGCDRTKLEIKAADGDRLSLIFAKGPLGSGCQIDFESADLKVASPQDLGHLQAHFKVSKNSCSRSNRNVFRELELNFNTTDSSISFEEMIDVAKDLDGNFAQTEWIVGKLRKL